MTESTRKIIDQRFRGNKHVVSLIFYDIAKNIFNNSRLISDNVYQSSEKFAIIFSEEGLFFLK